MQDGCTENLGRGRKLSPGQAQAQQSHSLAFHLLNNTLCGIPRNLGMAKNTSSSKTGIHLLHVFLAVMGHRELRGDSYQGAAEPGSSCCATKASTVLKLSWLDWVGNGKKNYCSGNTQRAQIQGTQKKNPTPKDRKAPKGVPGSICGHLCILRGRHSSAPQRRGSPGMGGTNVSPSQAQMSPCSPLCISPTKPRDAAGGQREPANLGWVEGAASEVGTRLLPEPPEVLRAKADLHRPAGSSQPRLLLGKTFPNPAGRNGALPHRTVPVFQSWGRLWGLGIPASCPRKGGSVGSCQLRTQEILGLSLLSIFLVHPGLLPGNLPHCFLLFWKLGGCKRQGCCSKGRLAVLSVQQGSPGP